MAEIIALISAGMSAGGQGAQPGRQGQAMPVGGRDREDKPIADAAPRSMASRWGGALKELENPEGAIFNLAMSKFQGGAGVPGAGAPGGPKAIPEDPMRSAWDRYMQNYGATGQPADPMDADIFERIWK